MPEDGVDAHRHSTCISEPALLSNAQVKKRVSSLLRSDAFFLACPCRLEAVTRILTKLFTTAWPLQVFLQLVAAWAYKHKWSVLASHIPGEHNVRADQLSRGNTSAFDSKRQARFRFRPHDFWPHQCKLSLHPRDAPWRPEHISASQTLRRGGDRYFRPFAWNPELGAYEKAPQWVQTRAVFPPAPPSLNFQATPHKEKKRAYMFVGRTSFIFGCMFPFGLKQ